jgi:hypothetical protein
MNKILHEILAIGSAISFDATCLPLNNFTTAKTIKASNTIEIMGFIVFQMLIAGISKLTDLIDAATTPIHRSDAFEPVLL